MTKIYAVVFEPFEVDGLEYVKEGDKGWTVDSPVKVFPTKALAQIEADKWNTGEVVELSEFEAICFNRSRAEKMVKMPDEENEPDFIME